MYLIVIMILFGLLIPFKVPVYSAAKEIPADVLKFEESSLNFDAVEKGYGYKTANLYQLEKLIFSFNQQNYPMKLQVPFFVGISSNDVVQALSVNGFLMDQAWQKVLETLSQEEKQQALKTKKLPGKFWQAQEFFLKELDQAFAKLSKENPFNLDSEKLQSIQELFTQAKQDKLMVRSTGKEDMRTLANAGGNETVSSVEPTMLAVLIAANEVIKSYFGEKSLYQRLGLGDTTVFDSSLFCPLLLQRMIGETKQEIPRCGVMFTEEVEGGIGHLGDLSNPIKTTGITMIQAAYGHNEGVVNSKVVVDSYLSQMIDSKPVFYPYIQAKRERLIRGSGRNLVMKKNDKNLVTKSALSKKELCSLKLFAHSLESYYGYPMDVEFVIRDQIIWIVQARPITYNTQRKTIIPSYIQDGFLPGALSYKGRTIGACGGAVVEILKADDCIMNSRIGGALDEYLPLDGSMIRAVFSGSDAPATSHEATVFRGEGKPVCFIHELGALQNQFTEDKKIVFSPQQHMVFVVDQAFNVSENLINGWCSYPVPRGLSVVQELFINENKRDNDELQAVALDVKTLLCEMAQEDGEHALGAAQAFPFVLKTRLNRALQEVKVDTDILAMQDKILGAARVLSQRIAWLIEQKAPLLERLLPINYLEALVYQQQSGSKELQYLSVAQLGKIIKQELVGKAGEEPSIVVRTGEIQAYVLQLNKLTGFMFDDEAQVIWQRLLSTFADLGEIQALQKLSSLVATLIKFDILPLWLHTVMVHEVKWWPSKEYSALLDKWIVGLESQGTVMIRFALLKQRLADFAIDRFADPKKYKEAWLELQKLSSAFCDESLLSSFKALQDKDSAAKITGAAISNLMTNFVDFFDGAIKAMKGSKLWKIEDQLVAFQAMLKGYFDLLKCWVRFLPQPRLLLPGKGGMNLQDYLDLMNRLISKPFTADDLKPTVACDAMVFSLGAGHHWMTDKSQNQQPERGEDGYTIIHQSLLNCCSNFLLSCGIEKVVFPQEQKDLVDLFDIVFVGRTKNLIGLNILQEKLTRVFNIALGSHSLQLVCDYWRKNKQISLEVNCFGGVPSEAYRWVNSAVLAVLHAVNGSFDVEVKKLGQTVLILNIKNIKKFADFKVFLQNFKQFVCSTNSSDIIPFGIDVTQKNTADGARLLKDFKNPYLLLALAQYYWFLLEQGIEIDDTAEKVASCLIELDRENPFQVVLVGLLTGLLKKNRGIKEVAGFFKKMSVKKEFNYVLIGTLLNRYLLNEDSFYVIKSLLKSKDTSQKFSLFLSDEEDTYFKKCLESCNFLPPLRAAVELIECEDDKEYKKGFKLFKLLIKKGQVFDEAIKFIMEKIKEEETTERAFSLFDCLLENQRFQKSLVEKMIPFCLEYLQSESLKERLFGRKIFEKLYRVPSADQKILDCIKGILDNHNIALRRDGKSLFEGFLNADLCFDTLNLVYKFAQSYLVRDDVLLGLDLYTILMNKDICVENLVADVKQMNLFSDFEQFKRANKKVKGAFISFWKSSAQGAENFEAVVIVAVYAIKEGNDFEGINLLECLIEGGTTKETIKKLLTEKLTPEEQEKPRLKEFFES